METDIHKCEFCASILKSRHTLLEHKKNSKKCLALQRTLLPKELVKSGLVTCLQCNSQFVGHYIKQHSLVCKGKNEQVTKLELQVEKLKSENAQLLDLMKKEIRVRDSKIEKLELRLEKKKTIRETWYAENLPLPLILNTERTRAVLEGTTMSEWMDAKLLGKFIAKHMLVSDKIFLYVPRDKSRKYFAYKTARGTYELDVNGAILMAHITMSGAYDIACRKIRESDKFGHMSTTWLTKCEAARFAVIELLSTGYRAGFMAGILDTIIAATSTAESEEAKPKTHCLPEVVS